MPSQFTHKFAAWKIYLALPENVRAEISCLPAYFLGAQGPDLFYFLYPFSDRGKLGRFMHGAGVYEAVSAVCGYADTPPAFSYAAGFVTHCALDRVFHPYILGMAENLKKSGYSEKLGLHGYIESDLDTYFVRKFLSCQQTPAKQNTDPSEAKRGKKNTPGCRAAYRPELCNSRELEPLVGYLCGVIARLLGRKVSPRALSAALRRFCLFSRAFSGERSTRRKVLYFLESSVGANHTFSSRCRRPQVDPACLNRELKEWRDPADPSFFSHEDADRVFVRAVSEGVRLLDLFYICRAAGQPLPREDFSKALIAYPRGGEKPDELSRK